MEKKDQVVYVKDLLFAALYRWRLILVMALIGAVLLGGFKAFSGMQDLKANNDSTQQSPSPSQNAEIAVIEQEIGRLQSNISSEQTYLKESILMNLDSSAVFTANIDIYIKPETPNENSDSAPELLYGYHTALTNSSMSDQLSAALDIPGKYAQELISVTKITDSSRILNIKIRGDSQENVQKLSDIVSDYLQQTKTQLTETVGLHSISVIYSGVFVCEDSELNDFQAAAASNLTAQLDALAEQEKQLAALKSPVLQSTTSTSVIKSAIVFAVIGAVLGGGIAACFAWFMHLAGSKVYSARTLKNRTGLNILTCLPASGKTNAIDRLLKKAEGRYLDGAQAVIAAATVSTYCGSNNKLMIVGNCDQTTWGDLLEALKKTGIEAYAAGSLLKNADALLQLSNYDNILLIEQCGYSSYTDVSKTITVIHDLGKQLIGCVLVDG